MENFNFNKKKEGLKEVVNNEGFDLKNQAYNELEKLLDTGTVDEVMNLKNEYIKQGIIHDKKRRLIQEINPRLREKVYEELDEILENGSIDEILSLKDKYIELGIIHNRKRKIIETINPKLKQMAYLELHELLEKGEVDSAINLKNKYLEKGIITELQIDFKEINKIIKIKEG